MYICICNAITDKQIRKAAESGARNIRDLKRELGVAANCGTCQEDALQILQESRQERRAAGPVVYRPALA